MNILLPVDFSKESENARKFATAVAKAAEGKVIFLHAFPVMYNFASLAEESWSSVRRSSGNLMRKFVRELEGLGISGRYHVIQDNLVRAIESIVTQEEINLIIMSTKGAKGLRKFLVGTNASEVLKGIDAPVLIIPIDADYSKMEKIVITMEKAEDAPLYIKKILALTQKWGLSYEILHFNTPYDEEPDNFSVKHISSLERMYPGTTFRFRTTFSTDIQDSLELYQKGNPEAMLVMLASHKGLLENYFSKSDTGQMVFHPALPILVIKEDELHIIPH